MARMVNTVTGPVSSDQLGGVLAHEHFIFGYPGFHGDVSFDTFNTDAYLAHISAVADTLKKQGIKTVVDATPNECGRDPELLKKVSEVTGLNIICSTGYYYEEESASSYFTFRTVLGFDTENEIYELMKRETGDGIAKTGIKAGVVKLASGKGAISKYEMLFFKAACRLARENKDIRIITHTSEGTCILEQAELFLSEGVNPKQVQIGHFCGTTDVMVQSKALEMGFYGAFDRLGLENMVGAPYDKYRFACIAALVSAGFGDQLVLSTDHIQAFRGRPYTFPPQMIEAHFKNWRWEYIMDGVLPALKKLGLSDEQLHKFMFDNPARFYGEV